MKKQILLSVLALATADVMASSHGKGLSFEIGAGVYDYSEDFNYGAASSVESFNEHHQKAIGVEYGFCNGWAANLGFSAESAQDPDSGNGDVEHVHLDAVKYFAGQAENGGCAYSKEQKRMIPYVVAGVGRFKTNPDETMNYRGVVNRTQPGFSSNGNAISSQDETLLNAGVGVKFNLSDRFALKTDLRRYYSTDNERTITGFNMMLSYAFDHHPYMPKNVDMDKDGVPDAQDQCSGTAMGVQVDSKGCALDSDADGIADYMDDCPGTGSGSMVGSNGCIADMDKDGIADANDRCPESVEGLAVNSLGCAVGSEITFSTFYVNFTSGSNNVTEDSKAQLSEVADFVKMNDAVTLILEGHTDSTGSEALNLDLSEQRAKAVGSVLVDEYSVNADQIKYRAVGEANPVASNSTEEGRKLNRRVEAKISE